MTTFSMDDLGMTVWSIHKIMSDRKKKKILHEGEEYYRYDKDFFEWRVKKHTIAAICKDTKYTIDGITSNPNEEQDIVYLVTDEELEQNILILDDIRYEIYTTIMGNDFGLKDVYRTKEDAEQAIESKKQSDT